ncbi:MAG: glycosyltransferase, partial [Bryobacteraceae bacterium]
IMEAMAMGKAIVSTPAGVNGLDIRPDEEAIIASTPEQFADAVRLLLGHPGRRRALGARARIAAGQRFDWNQIADRHRKLLTGVT